MAKSKATHSGHCQCCGSLQKLPNGTLSLHGYQVAGFGFFNGVCRGARELPIEVSCDLIKHFIAIAKEQLADVEAQQHTLRTVVPTDQKCWVHNYERSLIKRGTNHYAWRRVTLLEEKREHYSNFFYIAPGTDSAWSRNANEEARHDMSGHYGKTVNQLAHEQNCKFADWLEHRAVSLRRYISWQQSRVDNWKPAPLLPVDTKDKKATFELEQPRYSGVVIEEKK